MINKLKNFVTSVEFLTNIFVTMLILSNIVANKLFYITPTISFNVGTFLYLFTFLISNIISKKFGSDVSKGMLKSGLMCSVVTSIILFILNTLPTLDSEMQLAFNKVLGNNWIFVIGSLTAYFASQFLNHKIFNKTKKNYINNLGCMCVGTIVDTIIFVTIAFGLGFGWLWNNTIQLTFMIISQTIVKLVITIIISALFEVSNVNSSI